MIFSLVVFNGVDVGGIDMDYLYGFIIDIFILSIFVCLYRNIKADRETYKDRDPYSSLILVISYAIKILLNFIFVICFNNIRNYSNIITLIISILLFLAYYIYRKIKK